MATAVILAGGRGTRLQGVLPSGYPKPLALVHGRPVIAWHLDLFLAAGFDDIRLALGFGAAHIVDYVRHAYGPKSRSRMKFCTEANPLDTGGALCSALAGDAIAPVLVHNADSYLSYDLSTLLDTHVAKSAQATMVVTEQEDCGRFGRVIVNAEGGVLRFQEKCGDAGCGWINAGAYVFERRTLAAWPRHIALSLERQILPSLVGNGLFCLPVNAPFIDIGTPEGIARAERVFTRRDQERGRESHSQSSLFCAVAAGD